MLTLNQTERGMKMATKLKAPQKGTQRGAVLVLADHGWSVKEIENAMRLPSGRVGRELRTVRAAYGIEPRSLGTGRRGVRH